MSIIVGQHKNTWCCDWWTEC